MFLGELSDRSNILPSFLVDSLLEAQRTGGGNEISSEGTSHFDLRGSAACRRSHLFVATRHGEHRVFNPALPLRTSLYVISRGSVATFSRLEVGIPSGSFSLATQESKDPTRLWGHEVEACCFPGNSLWRS